MPSLLPDNDPTPSELSTGSLEIEAENSDPVQPSSSASSRGADNSVRVIGFSAAELDEATWLPDDPTGWARLIKAKGPFNGAFIPLVLHEPALAERSIDAAEWAADLIWSEKGSILCIAPFAGHNVGPAGELSARQWNHMAVMIERLEDVAKRFTLEIFVKDVERGVAARDELGLKPKLPVTYAIDTGSFLSEGYIPTLLRCSGPDSDHPSNDEHRHDEHRHDEHRHDEHRHDEHGGAG